MTLAAYNVAIKFLGLADYSVRVLHADQNIECYAFTERREQRPVFVYWAQKDGADLPKNLALKIDTAELTLYDVMGNATPLKRNNDGNWSIPLLPKQEPLYLVGATGKPAQTLLDSFSHLPETPGK